MSMYQRLLEDVDNESRDLLPQGPHYNPAAQAAHDERVRKAKEERVREWNRITSNFPACDEEILYQVFSGCQYQYSSTVSSLASMGIQPGLGHVVDSEPPKRRTEQEVLDSLLGTEVSRLFPHVDRSIRVEVIEQSGNDFDKAVQSLESMGFQRQQTHVPRPGQPAPQQYPQYPQQQQQQRPQQGGGSGGNVPTGDLIQF
eukprot:comp16996_c0_seq1/m.15666 comp16996_c0_seq1/g.15666  ORF comp16996_c0_seq1/g.15666 comp16996_c0_seq1/m.15666 type:complete len:200 (-) comp16996_c0_seq1:426-1025(-)